MRILIANDDGIDAPGLVVAEEIAREIAGPDGEIWTVAPQTNHSGAGHALTYTSVIRTRKIRERRYSVDGTPADCVIMGVETFLEGQPPDLVLTGVNYGRNVANDVLISGTVAAAIEASLRGTIGIALSQGFGTGSDQNDIFAPAREHGAAVVRRLLSANSLPRACFNVNFPARPTGGARGLRLAPAGMRPESALRPAPAHSPRLSADYYWLAYNPDEPVPDQNCDQNLCSEGWITATPITTDITAHERIKPDIAAAIEFDC